MSIEKKVKKSSIFTLMIFTLGSRVLGLVREMVKAKYLGSAILNDAFNAAFTIPNLLRRLFAESSMTVAFIPTFKGYLKNDNKKETKDFINATFTALTFIVTITVVLGIIFTPIIVKVFKAQNTDIPELILLTRVMFPYLAFISLAALCQGVLNSLNIFGPGGFVPILFNIITIIITILFTKLKVTANPARAMAIGITLGGVSQMAFQLPYILKNGFGFKLTSLKKAFNNKGTKKVGRLITPTLASMGAYQLSTAVAQMLALNTGVGISSALGYSLRLQELVLGIFAVSIGTILISTLSRDAKDKNWGNFTSSLQLSVNVIAFLTIPITVFAYIHSTEIVTLVYKSGAFGEKGVLMTSQVFRIHISGLYFIALSRVIAPAFFSLEDSKTPAILGVISVVFGIILMFTLASIFKGQGIAVATILSSTLLTILYFIFLGKKEDINFKSIMKSSIPAFIRITIFSLLAAIPLLKYKDRIFNIFNTGNRIIDFGMPLIITTLLYFSVYVIILIITKENVLKELKRLARRP